MKTNDRNMIPPGGKNIYADHPGYDAGSCPIRYTVTQRSGYGVPTSGGFGCEMTGGHCLPGEFCDDRRARAEREDAMKAQFEQTRDQPKVYPSDF